MRRSEEIFVISSHFRMLILAIRTLLCTQCNKGLITPMLATHFISQLLIAHDAFVNRRRNSWCYLTKNAVKTVTLSDEDKTVATSKNHIDVFEEKTRYLF